MIADNLKHLLLAHEEGYLTNDELHVRAFQVLMEDDFKIIRNGWAIGAGTTCCCRYPHNLKEDYLEAELHIHPHGYYLYPKGSWWQRFIKLFRRTPKTLSRGSS